jgi:uncharacterized DUF497 family protein
LQPLLCSRFGRLRVIPLMDWRVYAAVVTRRGDDVRVISSRKASRREVQRYGKKGG